MTENDKIDAFMLKRDLTAAEKVVQDKCRMLQENYKNSMQELQTFKQELQNKELEFLRTKNYLELSYAIILDIEDGKTASKEETVNG